MNTKIQERTPQRARTNTTPHRVETRHRVSTLSWKERAVHALNSAANADRSQREKEVGG